MSRTAPAGGLSGISSAAGMSYPGTLSTRSCRIQPSRSPPMTTARIAFCTCRRFSASSHTTLCGPSITSADDLLAAVRGEAVQEDRVGRRAAHELRRPRCNRRRPSRGSFCSSSWPIDAQTSVFTTCAPATASRGSRCRVTFACSCARVEQRGVGVVALGAREREVEAEAVRGVEPGVRHVVAVADPRDVLPLERAEVLAHGEEVGEHLAGVLQVGEAVDHGHSAWCASSSTSPCA